MQQLIDGVMQDAPQAEIDSHTAALCTSAMLLATCEAAKIVEIQEWRIAQENAGVVWNTKTWRSGDLSQNRIMNAISLFTAGKTYPPGFKWFDINEKPVTITQADLVLLAGVMFDFVNDLYAQMDTKIAAVEAIAADTGLTEAVRTANIEAYAI